MASRTIRQACVALNHSCTINMYVQCWHHCICCGVRNAHTSLVEHTAKLLNQPSKRKTKHTCGTYSLRPTVLKSFKFALLSHYLEVIKDFFTNKSERKLTLVFFFLFFCAAYHVPNWLVTPKACKTNTPANTATRSPGQQPQYPLPPYLQCKK